MGISNYVSLVMGISNYVKCDARAYSQYLDANDLCNKFN